MKKWWLFILVLSATATFGQEGEKDPLSVNLEGGYLMGGQITSNTFTYQSGLSFRASLMKNVHENFQFGGGIGFDNYDYIEFYPIFLKVATRPSSDRNGMFVSHIGYSLADDGDTNISVDSEIEGGFFLELGRSWTFRITDELNLVSGISFKHQFGVLEIENSVGDDLRESADFDGLHIRLGIQIK